MVLGCADGRKERGKEFAVLWLGKRGEEFACVVRLWL
jgi:hypothetical protein